MRHDYQTAGRPWALKWILIVLVAVFLLQNILRHWVGTSFLETYFALYLRNLADGWIYTLVSYGFLHSTHNALPWHLVFNALMLFWFGKEIEERIGSERFLELFLFCVLSGGIIWSCVHFLMGLGGGVVGASAGVFGILYLFCRYRWNMAMELMIIRIRFTGQQLFWVLMAFQVFFFLFAEIPGSTANNNAYSAHLGGILGAFIYERKLLYMPTLISFFRKKSSPAILAPKWKKRAEASKSSSGNNFTVNLTSKKDLKEEVDRILDKINDHGFGALTEEEKSTLDQARKK
jgi:membrane associated rhomboid family serine protease